MLLFGGKDTKILRYHQIIVDKKILTVCIFAIKSLR
jgi:hypothetical protein